ncbi:hypothetical protein QBC34DRAFT_412394 [Podospora aff. communis PSN243]|uniref:2EXR domain-containing protein n=1 Tax=Podospora aff. communis PSN243 TaxID=3040156 RepID=A0AAV9GCH9_9PEZI|nr:hypothetical protein QBC34DRAFT_412394 [Podospora aff. communis PSN243]
MSSLPDEEEVAGLVVFDDSDEEDASAAKHESASDAASESDSEDELQNNRLHVFDLEASEEDNDSDQEEDHEEDGDDEIRFFPQFMRLPIELRYKIWELFSPELTAAGRVLEVPRNGNTFILANQTASSRAVLSTHRESREFALKTLPDLLPMPHARFSGFDPQPLFIRFNKEKDIVLFPRVNLVRFAIETPPTPDFLDQVRNLALWLHQFDSQASIPRPISVTPQSPPNLHFPNLKNLFFLEEASSCPWKVLRWCGSDKVKRSLVTQYRETIEGVVQFVHREMYCWPDLEKHRDFAEHEIPLVQLWRNNILPGYPGTDADSSVEEQLKKLSIWPLISFNDDEIDRLERFRASNGAGESWDSESSDDDDSGVDDYESSGIDDEEIAEDSEDDVDEDDLLMAGGEQDSDEDEERTSEFGGFSPLQGPNGIVDLAEDGHFSSPEPESTTVQGESDESDSDEPVARQARMKSSRKRVLDESDEDEEDSEDSAPLRRQPRKRARHAHRVDDTDEDDSDDQGGKPSGGDRDESGEESSEGSEEESDEEDAPPRTMSLAERLQLHRRQNPVPDEQDSESSGDFIDEDAFAIPGYTDFDDDDDGEDGEDYPKDGQEELMIDLNEEDEYEDY